MAATISITNVMNFEATHQGTMMMSTKLNSARARFFDSVDGCCFNAAEANSNFFDNDK